MFSKEELDTAAKTLMSMCTDYLTGGLTEGTFRKNLKMFADLANPPINKEEKTVQQSKIKMPSLKEVVDALDGGAQQGDVSYRNGIIAAHEYISINQVS